MSDLDLRRLWQLAEVDNAMAAIRKRAASMDGGKSILEQYKELESKTQTVVKAFKDHQADHSAAILELQAAQAKNKRLNDDLYSGKITSAREIETLEKEIESVKRLEESLHTKVQGLVPELGEKEAKAKAAEERLEKAKKVIEGEKRKIALTQHEMQAEFQKLGAARPKLVEGIPQGLIARYDAIRKKEGGIGMTKIDGSQCGACKTLLPEKTIESVKDGRITTCESCHRILYFTEGLF